MPILENPKQELFAQALASGSSADEAYQRAGYTAHRGNASRMSANENVLRRVAELQERAATGVVISRQRVLEELSKIAFAALGHEYVKTADKRAAAVDIARIEGWIVEKRESGKPGEFDGLTPDELRSSLAREIGVDTESLAKARRARKQGGVRGQPGRVH